MGVGSATAASSRASISNGERDRCVGGSGPERPEAEALYRVPALVGLSVAIESAELDLLGGHLTDVRLGPATGKVKMVCKGVELKEFHHEFKLLPKYHLKSPLDLSRFAASAAREPS
jgi:hypothetical protein